MTTLEKKYLKHYVDFVKDGAEINYGNKRTNNSR